MRPKYRKSPPPRIAQVLRVFCNRACFRVQKRPVCAGEDGRAVLEAIFAAYASAGEGRRIDLPFRTDAQRSIDLWQRPG